MRKKIFGIVAISILGLSTFSCSTIANFAGKSISLVLEKGDIIVSTKLSETIWLEPTEKENHVVFLQVKNTSDQDIKVKESIKEALIKGGYQVVDEPSKAFYQMRINILKAGYYDSGEGTIIAKDRYFEFLTDLYITENTDFIVQKQKTGIIGQGNSGADSQSSTIKRKRLDYTTRVHSTATKVNLTQEESINALSAELVKVVSGIFVEQ